MTNCKLVNSISQKQTKDYYLVEAMKNHSKALELGKKYKSDEWQIELESKGILQIENGLS